MTKLLLTLALLFAGFATAGTSPPPIPVDSDNAIAGTLDFQAQVNSGITDLITNTLGTGMGAILCSCDSVRSLFARLGL